MYSIMINLLSSKNEINLPVPKNISLFYNFGFMLAATWMTQILSGILLASSYAPVWTSYFMIMHVMEDLNSGYMMRFIHSNGASLLFILLFTHTARGLYYKSYKKSGTWYTGSLILILAMAISFMGYVLPNNQMSYWGCMVITSMLSEIPLIGPLVVTMIWGGAEISQSTMNRLFSFHFFLPLASIVVLAAHILALHSSGSSNPTGMSTTLNKSYFFSYSLVKDMFMLFFWGGLFLIVVLIKPLMFGDHDNFNMANKMDTPTHIQPEWYFLFAYAILRSIPNKMGGVFALAMSVIIIPLLPKLSGALENKTQLNNSLFWIFAGSFITLTFLGSKPVEDPYPLMANLAMIQYFSFFIMSPHL